MSAVIELDTYLHLRVTPQSASGPTLRPLPDTPASLDTLVNTVLPGLLQSAVTLERARPAARRVDGLIIGTGEADFTKGNSLYTLHYKGKTFQLLDVPGIEGDENRYTHLVNEAVAKAHLVFYVNGTNKKPETATVQKIRAYLRRGTQVCPLVNVRGSADAYEFEEDRVSLERQGGADQALLQTEKVLASALGQGVLLHGQCVQGLLAFSALAIDSSGRNTTIHPSRDRDLAVQQRNYLKHFGSPKAMYEYSQIRQVAAVLQAKLGTFKADIIESNKTKVRELISENTEVLEKALKDHQVFMAKLAPEFSKCRTSISEALRTFERLVSAGRKNLWIGFFNDLTEQANDTVATHFGDNDIISSKIQRAFKSGQIRLGERLESLLEEHLKTLQDDLQQALERLLQDVQRIDFQQRLAVGSLHQKAVYQTATLDMGLGAKGWGSIAFNVGSYAASGAGIGSIIPGVGTAIGAAVGAVVGLLMSALSFFTSKEKRIRKAQAQVQAKIDETRDEAMGKLADGDRQLMAPIRDEVNSTVLRQVESLYTNLNRPKAIIEQQVALMRRIQRSVENMPHGTIQPIQS